MSRTLGPSLLVLAASLVFAQQGAITPDPKTPRPIAALDSVWIEELTWMEVRDAMKAGKTTVIIPTGGIEQSGPYAPTGRHNYVPKVLAEAIARKLGNALVAPVVPWVPNGTFDPPTDL